MKFFVTVFLVLLTVIEMINGECFSLSNVIEEYVCTITLGSNQSIGYNRPCPGKTNTITYSCRNGGTKEKKNGEWVLINKNRGGLSECTLICA